MNSGLLKLKWKDSNIHFFIRSININILHKAIEHDTTDKRSSILAPLDNLIWDRTLIKELFDFEYRWEVYKPVAER
ncbi:DNA glycosylase AlkZ-like family protein [Paenibacillus sp. GCM10027629]|uniref:DNA glycosylase AlkZ-like family protein n=1 Tax=Paenibacillus sp. GCM10027629 TaxID=3273414 RepID=UPI00363796AD